MDVDYDFELKKDLWSKKDIKKIFSAHQTETQLTQLFELLEASVNAQKLLPVNVVHLYEDTWYDFDPFDFIDWAIRKDIPSIPTELIDWHAKQIKSEPQAEAVDEGSPVDKETPALLKEQQDNILKAIKALKLEPMEIQTGKKKVIQQYCENEYAESFKGSTSFDRAWDKGKKELWKMKYHDSYARRGNN